MTTVINPPTAESGGHGVAQSRGLFDAAIMRQALMDSITKLNPMNQVRNPRDVRGARGIDHQSHRSDCPPRYLHVVDHDLALSDRDLRQLRRGHGGGAGQGQAETLRKIRPEASL